MARLIDADAAMSKAIICTNAVIFGDESEAMITFVSTLQNLLIIAFDEAPTIEAQPVRHGRWNFTSCSLCGKASWIMPKLIAIGAST